MCININFLVIGVGLNMLIDFIERFRELDPLLIESVLAGYAICFESEYYRGTNNKSEEDLIKSGDMRPSLNHIDKSREKGLSVSDTDNVGKYFKYLYKLRGTEVGEGSDGEPLLDVDSLEFVNWVTESIGYHGTPANFNDFNTPIVWFTLERDLAQEYAGNDGKVIERELDYVNPVRFHSSTQSKGIREFLGDFIEQSSVRDFSPRVRELHRLLIGKYGDSKQEIWNYFDDDTGMLREFAGLLGFDAIESSEGNSLTKRHATIGLFS